jgi:hypothetical protein|tara:strand:+ start:382 stop:495 length:114 start_codon:yes stop_codon:yes gene_type:complete
MNMFNINGNGKGHAFGVSAKMDGSSSDLSPESQTKVQ